MFRNPVFAACIATIYLVLYYILFQTGVSIQILGVMFLLSPVVIIWMTLTILKDKNHHVNELKEGEEWGYQDRDRSSLGAF